MAPGAGCRGCRQKLEPIRTKWESKVSHKPSSILQENKHNLFNRGWIETQFGSFFYGQESLNSSLLFFAGFPPTPKRNYWNQWTIPPPGIENPRDDACIFLNLLFACFSSFFYSCLLCDGEEKNPKDTLWLLGWSWRNAHGGTMYQGQIRGVVLQQAS